MEALNRDIFDRKKIVFAILLFIFAGACGWFWRHREYIPFVSQPLSTGAAPFEYGVSRAAWNTRDGLGILSQVLNNWKELDSLKKKTRA